MAINRWRSWLAACAAVSIGVAGSLFAGQTSQPTAIHDITSTGCLTHAGPSPTDSSWTPGATITNSTEFVLTNAVTVIPDADERTGFSSAKATIPNRVTSTTDTPDQYDLKVEAYHAIPHDDQKVAITGTIRGSQLKVHSIRMISPICR
jgi:hypothetical protein